MKYTAIQRAQDDFQQPIALDQLEAMCQRAFGPECFLLSITELAGGLYNNTYRICFQDGEQVILRVAPPSSGGSERYLMRNEVCSLPFFAPIVSLLPRVLMTDFTHQLLARDYMFQSFMPGECWEAISDTLTTEENASLWRQLGTLASKLHSVIGHSFGRPYPFPLTSRWSLQVFEWIETIIKDSERAELDASDLQSLLKLARDNVDILDEIKQPHLLHGDLWTVNILIQRGAEGPYISAILDGDHASWGDPMADWIFFLLPRHAHAQAFWESYGSPDSSREAQLRLQIYHACHIGGARLEHHRLHHTDKVAFSYQDMQSVLDKIRSLSFSNLYST